MWRAQIPALAERYRVIAPDLRGFGESAHVEGAVTLSTYAADVAALLDDLGIEEPVALVGFSMGGYAAFAFLRDFPARVGALALVDTKATADSAQAREGRRATAERVSAEGARVVADAMLPKLLSEEALEDADLKHEVHRMMAEQSPAAINQALAAMADRPDSTPMLTDIGVPTLVIVGETDQIATPEEAREMAAEIPGAHIVEIAGASHLTPMDAPHAVTEALLAWLKGVGGG
jgi:pimeloyl-ACP methyl ester carboxylesterase